MMRYIRAARMIIPALSLACGCGVEDLHRIESDSVSTAIIGGDVVVRGSMASRGVVRVGLGCTGTLLTNRYVLTARHCVRGLDDDSGAWTQSLAPVTVTLEGPTFLDDQMVPSVAIFEPNAVFSRADDYALIMLERPMVVDGSTEDHVIEIYPGLDEAMVGQEVACMGYGFGTWAVPSMTPGTAGTPMMGGGTLRSATMVVDSVVGGMVSLLPNAAGQIQVGGDSGSPCFLNDRIISVHSGGMGILVDVDMDGELEGNEFISRSVAQQSAASVWRVWAEDIAYADATASVRFLPSSSTQDLWVVFGGPAGWGYVYGASVANDALPRGSWYEASVWFEPTGFFCTSERKRPVPEWQNVRAHLRCLSDGVLPALL